MGGGTFMFVPPPMLLVCKQVRRAQSAHDANAVFPSSGRGARTTLTCRCGTFFYMMSNKKAHSSYKPSFSLSLYLNTFNYINKINTR
jgi:hypothetical protein